MKFFYFFMMCIGKIALWLSIIGCLYFLYLIIGACYLTGGLILALFAILLLSIILIPFCFSLKGINSSSATYERKKRYYDEEKEFNEYGFIDFSDKHK